MNKKELKKEIEVASNYIQQFLPEPLSGIVSVDWRYIPGKTIGGDAFGYGWMDQDHFFVYLLDVAGNGVKAALHLSTIIHVLHELKRKKDSSLLHPKELFQKLNQEFPMQENDNAFFTMWHGVYDKHAHILTFASAGHPAAILLPRGKLLQTNNPAIGVGSFSNFEEEKVAIDHSDLLYIMSDGVFELQKRDGKMQTFTEFLQVLKTSSGSDLDQHISTCHEITGKKCFEDDFSMVRLHFE